MKENTVIAFRNPADFQEDPLTEVLRAGAHKLLTQAIEAEVASFLAAHAEHVDDAGRRRVVRNGYLPARAIQTGIGPVKMAKTRWIKSTRGDHSRRQIRGWRTPGPRRRMISPYTTFDNSSSKGVGGPIR